MNFKICEKNVGSEHVTTRVKSSDGYGVAVKTKKEVICRTIVEASRQERVGEAKSGK